MTLGVSGAACDCIGWGQGWMGVAHLPGGMSLGIWGLFFMRAFSVECGLRWLILEQSRLGSYYLKIN